MTEQQQQIESVLTELGLSIDSLFIPWSMSRNKEEKHPSLNWKISVKHKGREILSCDYSAGMGHCPSYKQGEMSVDENHLIDWECGHGKTAMRILPSFGVVAYGAPIFPSSADVFSSLCSESDAINYSSFEEWAESFGYDSDSKSAEKIYQECLRIGLALRNALGEQGFNKLREAFSNY